MFLLRQHNLYGDAPCGGHKLLDIFVEDLFQGQKWVRHPIITLGIVSRGGSRPVDGTRSRYPREHMFTAAKGLNESEQC